VKVLEHIANCRTAALGGHWVKCSHCDYEKVIYNSCGDSNCPQCQNIKKELWIDKMVHHLLPIQHYHLIFTVPHQLNDLFFYNQRKMYRLFFQAAWQTIQSFAVNGKTGMVATLHSWGSNLSYHPHIHAIVPSGLLQNGQWKRLKGTTSRFFVPSKILREQFKTIFLRLFCKLIENEELRLNEEVLSESDFQKIKQIERKIRKLKWTVRVECPILGVKQIIEYLGRYIKRVAITNSRIIDITATQVRFLYNDYQHQEEGKPPPKAIRTMDGERFLQQFSQHILPPYFHRVRYFGIYAFTNKTKKEEAYQSIKGQPQLTYQKPSKRQLLKKMLGTDPDVCPSCGEYQSLTLTGLAENGSVHFRLAHQLPISTVRLKMGDKHIVF